MLEICSNMIFSPPSKELRNILFRHKIWKPNSNKSKSQPLRPTKINKPLQFASINSRSAVNKAALIHDLILHHQIDVLAITETWISADAPAVIKSDIT